MEQNRLGCESQGTKRRKGEINFLEATKKKGIEANSMLTDEDVILHMFIRVFLNLQPLCSTAVSVAAGSGLVTLL